MLMIMYILYMFYGRCIVLVSLIIDMTYSISVTYIIYCLGHAKFITFDSVNL